MKEWVGVEPRFHPHAAQYEFEAWLLPYWATIQKMAGHNAAAPLGPPEDVNHGNPPARRIKTLFEAGAGKRSYVKPRDARAILDKNGLDGAVSQCVELKALVNTILSVSGAEPIP